MNSQVNSQVAFSDAHAMYKKAIELFKPFLAQSKKKRRIDAVCVAMNSRRRRSVVQPPVANNAIMYPAP